jgi:hypothetical protein
MRPGRAQQRRGEPGDHRQNSDGDTAQPALVRGISSAFFGLTLLSCASVILNLFSLYFARLLSLLFDCCFARLLVLLFFLFRLFFPFFLFFLFLLSS